MVTLQRAAKALCREQLDLLALPLMCFMMALLHSPNRVFHLVFEHYAYIHKSMPIQMFV